MAVIVQTSTFRFSSLSITASPLGLVRSPFFRVRVFALAIKRRRLSSVTLVPEELFFSHTLQLITCGLFSLGFCGFPLPVLSVFYTECIVALFRALFCFFFFFQFWFHGWVCNALSSAIAAIFMLWFFQLVVSGIVLERWKICEGVYSGNWCFGLTMEA